MDRSRKSWGKWAAGAAAIACVAGTGLVSLGCAIHTQAPIREIAYDFSDRDFYDRAYAPSPKYLDPEEIYAGPYRTPARPERTPGRMRPGNFRPADGEGAAPVRPLILRPGAPSDAPPAPGKAKAPAKPRPAQPAKPKAAQ